ncbi:MAG: WXG100 family type VII secretion target [Actinoplanes sp.]
MSQPLVGTTQEGMQNALKEFEGKSTQFSGTLQSVNTQMAALQASWDGNASSNFNGAMDSWEGGFRRVIDALNSMIESLGGNKQMYSAQEDDAASIASSFASALPNAVSDSPAAGLPGV